MDPKQKMSLIVGGGLAGLLIAGLAALFCVELSAVFSERDERDEAESSLDSRYGASVFPSEANRKIRESDAQALKDWADAAHALFTRGPAAPQGETPSQFNDRLSKKIRSLNERQADALAAVAAQGEATEGVMDYSFGRYVLQGEMPKEEDVPRLAAQFAVIEHVCTVLLDQGARQIVSVTRTPFDTAAAAAPEEARASRRSRNRRNAEAEKPAAAGAIVLDPVLEKDGLSGESFTIRFRARYAALAKALNALMQDERFIVVTDLSVSAPFTVKARVEDLERGRKNARLQAQRGRNRAGQGAAAEAAAEKERPLFEGASPAERLVTDPEHSPPLDIVLSFEVYSAPAPEAAETEGSN